VSEREEMPEITPEEAQILEELAEMHTEDPEGFEALIGDTETGVLEDDPARAHAEQLLQIFDARHQERDKELLELLNDAYRAKAEEGNQP
jgi:hypothetical protein